MKKSVEQLLREQLEELCDLNKVIIKAIKTGNSCEENFTEKFRIINETILNIADRVSGQRDIYSRSIKRDIYSKPIS